MAVLLHRKPASTGTAHDSYIALDSITEHPVVVVVVVVVTVAVEVAAAATVVLTIITSNNIIHREYREYHTHTIYGWANN
jgi:hypothetical protein